MNLTKVTFSLGVWFPLSLTSDFKLLALPFKMEEATHFLCLIWNLHLKVFDVFRLNELLCICFLLSGIIHHVVS